MTLSQLRAQFPALRGRVWLNAAASSPTPQPVFDAMERYLRETVEHGDTQYPTWARFKDATRARLANFIGAQSDELAFTPNTSAGFHVIAQLLKERGITEVLTLESEFPSTTLPLLYDGLTVRASRVRADGTTPVEDLEAALTPSTGAIAVSAVSYASGYRIDLGAVSALCKSRGLAFVVNAAQGLGHVPIDVSALHVDFLAGTSHKWLWAGYGTGILFIAKPWLERGRLPSGGWLSVEPHEQFDAWVHATVTNDAHGFTATGTRFRKQASALESGAGAWVGLYALDAALQLHEGVGVSHTLAHVTRLQGLLRSRLRHAGFTPTIPDDPATLSGICVFPVRGPPIDVVRALLREAGIATTARGGGVRVSTHAFNDETDVDRLLTALARLEVKPG